MILQVIHDFPVSSRLSPYRIVDNGIGLSPVNEHVDLHKGKADINLFLYTWVEIKIFDFDNLNSTDIAV